MRFWYPIIALERPTAGLMRSSSLALSVEAARRTEIHRELLKSEASVTRMYCRAAFAELVSREKLTHVRAPGELAVFPVVVVAVAVADATVVVFVVFVVVSLSSSSLSLLLLLVLDLS